MMIRLSIEALKNCRLIAICFLAVFSANLTLPTKKALKFLASSFVTDSRGVFLKNSESRLDMDNFPSVERNKDLDHENGLYLGAVLTYEEAGKGDVEIFLLDSSDYKDAPPWSEVADIGFYGVIGSISFKDEVDLVSQASYFKEFAQSSSPQFRFLASHYPKDHLDRVTFAKPGQVPFDVTNHLWSITEGVFSVPTFSKTLNQNLKQLLTPQGGNYWVSAHTHAKTLPRPQRYVVGGLIGEEYFEALNIGSTTDYRAHGAIVERYQRGRNYRLDKYIGFREIPLFDYEPIILTAIPKAIGDIGRQYADYKTFRSLAPTLDEWTKETQSVSLLDIPASLIGAFNQRLPRKTCEISLMNLSAVQEVTETMLSRI